jgi:hypothetical protein
MVFSCLFKWLADLVLLRARWAPIRHALFRRGTPAAITGRVFQLL